MEDINIQQVVSMPSRNIFNKELILRTLSAIFGIGVVGICWILGGLYYTGLIFCLFLLTTGEWAHLNFFSPNSHKRSFPVRSAIFLGGTFFFIYAFTFLEALPDTLDSLWLIPLVWGTDTGAYFIGKKLGGPKPSFLKNISPNKTWTGFIGGSLVGTFVGATVFAYCYRHEAIFSGIYSWAFLLILGFFYTVVAHGGDLLESAIKRFYGVKDSGSWIPGHGGFLDRFDSVLMVIFVDLLLHLTGILPYCLWRGLS